jgi:hypothetical protein
MDSRAPISYLVTQTERLDLDRRAERAWQLAQVAPPPARRIVTAWVVRIALQCREYLQARGGTPNQPVTRRQERTISS